MTQEKLQPLNIVDTRTPAQIQADGCDYWPNSEPYALFIAGNLARCLEVVAIAAPVNHILQSNLCEQEKMQALLFSEHLAKKAAERRQHRRLLFVTLHRPDMRVFNGALRYLRDDRGYDWRSVTSLEVLSEDIYIIDSWLVIYYRPDMRINPYWCYSSYELHCPDDPDCGCERCQS